MTAAFCKLPLLAKQLPTKDIFREFSFTPMFQANEEEEEGGSGSMTSLAFLREKAQNWKVAKNTEVEVEVLKYFILWCKKSRC